MYPPTARSQAVAGVSGPARSRRTTRGLRRPRLSSQAASASAVSIRASWSDCDDPGHSRSVSTALLKACPQPPSAPFSHTVTGEPATRPQEPCKPGGVTVHVGEEEHAQRALHQVVAAVRRHPCRHVVLVETQVRQALLPCAPLAERYEGPGDVHRVDQPVTVDRTGCRQCRRSGTTAGVEYPLAMARSRHLHRGLPDLVPQQRRPAVELLGPGAEHLADGGLLCGHVNSHAQRNGCRYRQATCCGSPANTLGR
ncbi:hypothetical protein SVIOM74S_00027 [Streptomyces violarus]